jgi:AcrR family transcriptional regulator
MGRPKRIGDVELLAIARRVFIRDGAAGSTREIAAQAGVSEAAVFKRFSTKAELFVAAMMPPNIDIDGLIGAAEAISDPLEATTELAERMLAYFREALPVIRQLTQNPLIDLATVRRRFGVGPERRLSEAVPKYLAQQARAGRIACADPTAAAGLLIAATHSLALFEMMDAPAHGRAEVRALVHALWDGLSPPASGERRRD